ncbi:MAG: hypothetical protein RIS88_1136 [Pseudomonadota bacterium]|jgi:hypothetical protein
MALHDDRRRNYRTLFSGLLLAAACLPGLARADASGDTGLETLWESLWHQSGVPTRVVRWESGIRLRLSGVNAGAHRDTVMQALQAVTREAGVPLVDVTGQPGQPANLSVEITPDSAMEDNQPCATTLEFRHESRIDSAVVRMRGRDTWRCAHHEAMHVMGLRGHPAGQTVLSYFPVKVDALLPLDKVMLRAWYSPRMRGGMSPFEALQVMADEWVATQADRAAAVLARDRFFAVTIAQMHAFASGRGDVPAIVKRSGKATEEGVRAGRGEMSYFLGVAYLEGAAVPASDRALARHWLEQAASAGNRPAQARLAGFR